MLHVQYLAHIIFFLIFKTSTTPLSRCHTWSQGYNPHNNIDTLGVHNYTTSTQHKYYKFSLLISCVLLQIIRFNLSKACVNRPFKLALYIEFIFHSYCGEIKWIFYILSWFSLANIHIRMAAGHQKYLLCTYTKKRTDQT